MGGEVVMEAESSQSERRAAGPTLDPQPPAAGSGMHHAGGDGVGVAHGDRGRRHQGTGGVTGRDRLPHQHPSAQHLLPDERQLVEGVAVQRASGQVVGHGFTLGSDLTSPAAVGARALKICMPALAAVP
jgi:hypothetical protein